MTVIKKIMYHLKTSVPVFNPDGYITGQELAAGFTFANSSRVFRDQEHYTQAISGEIPLDRLPVECPRAFSHRGEDKY